MRMQGWLPWLGLAALLCLVWLIYQQGVMGPWIFDDFVNLGVLLDERHLGWQILLDRYLVSHSGMLGRPVSMLTFIFNAVVHGENLVAWKELNVLFHLLTGLAFFWVARRLFADLGGWQPRESLYGALLVSGLWLLHPLHVSTVLYTVQRMAILPTLFSALGLALYLSGRYRLSQGRAGWSQILLALGLCWPLAIFSKENGVLLGAYIVLLECLLPAMGNGQQRRLHLLLAAVVGLPVLLAMAYFAWQPNWLLGGYALREFGPLERVLTEARIVWGYVLWVFVPLQRYLGFMHDDVVISTGLLEPVSTLLAIIGWLILLGVMLALHRRMALLVSGIGLFLASHLLESTVFPLELVFEHRNYFGSFGLLFAAVGALSMVLRHSGLRSLLGLVSLTLLAIILLLRVQIWSDINSLYTAMWRAHPDSPRLVTTFAAQFARNGQFDHAFALLDRAKEPRTAIAGLYIECLQDRRIATSSLAAFKRSEGRGKIPDYFLGALVSVALLRMDGECLYDDMEYVSLLERVVEPESMRNGERYKMLIHKAHHLNRAGRLGRALEALEQAGKLEPRVYVPLSLRTEWLARAGDHERARESYLQLQGMVDTEKRDFSERMGELKALLEAGP